MTKWGTPAQLKEIEDAHALAERTRAPKGPVHEHQCPWCTTPWSCDWPWCGQQPVLLSGELCLDCWAIERRVRINGDHVDITDAIRAQAERWTREVRHHRRAFVQPGSTEKSRVAGFIAELCFVETCKSAGAMFTYHAPDSDGHGDAGDFSFPLLDGKTATVDLKARDVAEYPNLLVADVQLQNRRWDGYVGVELRGGAALVHGWITSTALIELPGRMAGKVPVHEVPYRDLRPLSDLWKQVKPRQ